jgi:hypothetical protein
VVWLALREGDDIIDGPRGIGGARGEGERPLLAVMGPLVE